MGLKKKGLQETVPFKAEYFCFKGGNLRLSNAIIKIKVEKEILNFIIKVLIGF